MKIFDLAGVINDELYLNRITGESKRSRVSMLVFLFFALIVGLCSTGFIVGNPETPNLMKALGVFGMAVVVLIQGNIIVRIYANLK